MQFVQGILLDFLPNFKRCQAKSPGQESMYLKPCKIINFRTPSQTTSKGMFRKLLNAPDHRVNTKTLYAHKQIVK